MPELLAKHALWRQLIADGVEVIFGNPGTFEQGMLDALRDHTELRYVMGLQEAAVVAMGTNYARLGRRCAVVQLHAAVGLGNAAGALQEALRGETPMLVLCGENTTDNESAGGYLAFDTVAVGKPVTKWAARVHSSEHFLQTVRQAWIQANTPPRGPVLLTFPMDVLDRVASDEIRLTSLPEPAGLPSEYFLDATAERLAAAKRPLFLIGDAVAWTNAEAELLELASLTGASVYGLCLTMAERLLGQPGFAGWLPHTSGAAVASVTRQADLVLAVGAAPALEIFPAPKYDYLNQSATFIHIDTHGGEIGKNVAPSLGCVADPKRTLADLAVRLRHRATASRAATAFDYSNLPALSPASDGFTAARMMQVLAEETPHGAVVLDESMTATAHLRSALRERADVSYLACLSRGLGSGWPAGVSAKLLHPDRPVIAVSADGSAMYVIAALWTAANLGQHVVFVACSNRSYQILKYNITDYWKSRGEPMRSFPFMDLCPPELRFDRLGEGMGLRGWRALDEESLRAALRGALAEPRAHVIDVVVK